MERNLRPFRNSSYPLKAVPRRERRFLLDGAAVTIHFGEAAEVDDAVENAVLISEGGQTPRLSEGKSSFRHKNLTYLEMV